MRIISNKKSLIVMLSIGTAFLSLLLFAVVPRCTFLIKDARLKNADIRDQDRRDLEELLGTDEAFITYLIEQLRDQPQIYMYRVLIDSPRDLVINPKLEEIYCNKNNSLESRFRAVWILWFRTREDEGLTNLYELASESINAAEGREIRRTLQSLCPGLKISLDTQEPIGVTLQDFIDAVHDAEWGAPVVQQKD